MDINFSPERVEKILSDHQAYKSPVIISNYLNTALEQEHKPLNLLTTRHLLEKGYGFRFSNESSLWWDALSGGSSTTLNILSHILYNACSNAINDIAVSGSPQLDFTENTICNYLINIPLRGSAPLRHTVTPQQDFKENFWSIAVNPSFPIPDVFQKTPQDMVENLLVKSFATCLRELYKNIINVFLHSSFYDKRNRTLRYNDAEFALTQDGVLDPRTTDISYDKVTVGYNKQDMFVNIHEAGVISELEQKKLRLSFVSLINVSITFVPSKNCFVKNYDGPWYDDIKGWN